MHFQRYGICILNVLKNARHLERDFVEAEHVEQEDLRLNTLTVPQKGKPIFHLSWILVGLNSRCLCCLCILCERGTNKQMQNQPTKKTPNTIIRLVGKEQWAAGSWKKLHSWLNGESICQDKLSFVSLTFCCSSSWPSPAWPQSSLLM